jgi:hypothetical protein
MHLVGSEIPQPIAQAMDSVVTAKRSGMVDEKG